jgi:hypothetical protein
MTPVAELHAAAAKLRQRAEKVPPWAPLLADLLDGAAAEYLKLAGPNPGPIVERMALAKVGGRELAVARAILGTDQPCAGRPA